MYSVGLNEICHVSGTFYEGRSAKFWYVYFELLHFHHHWIYSMSTNSEIGKSVFLA